MQKVNELILPTLTSLGYELVRVLLLGGNKKVLQIMIERIDSVPITINDCEIVSREVSRLLDVNDVVQGTYSLEVSSVGPNRPLVKKEDFLKFKGKEAFVETKNAIKIEHNAEYRFQKRFKGIIDSFEDDIIFMSMSPEENLDKKSSSVYKVCVPYDEILKAHLVDSYLKKAPKRR